MKQKKRTFLFLTLSSEAALDRLRLIGYGLFGLCAVAVTTLLVAGAQGYDIDRSTGAIIQNGLVLVDATPNDAQIYIDNANEEDRTPGRFALPSGVHTVRLERDGYVNWSKEISLSGSEVEWLYYPRLLPEVVDTAVVNDFSAINEARQSPDKRWLLLQPDEAKPTFELYDMDSEALLSSTITLPEGALAPDEDQQSVFEIIEWSQNSEFFLVKQTVDEAVSFTVVNRSQPRRSFSLSGRAGLPLRNVHFRGDNTVLFYAVINGSIRELDGRDGSVSAPLLSDIVYYEPVGSDKILFVQEKAKRTTLEAGVYQDGQSSFLYTFTKPAKEYFLQFETFESDEYVVVGSSAQHAVAIISNPLKTSLEPAADTITMRLAAPPTNVMVAPGNQFVSIQRNQDLKIYDIDKQEFHEWSFDTPVTTDAVWMDSHYLIGFDTENAGNIIEFDGHNSRSFSAGSGSLGAFFNRTYEYMLSVDDAGQGSKSLLQTNLLSEADR